MEYTEPSVKSKTTPEVLSVAKGDYVTSSTKADHVTSVVDDENDIVVIKEDEKTKLGQYIFRHILCSFYITHPTVS